MASPPDPALGGNEDYGIGEMVSPDREKTCVDIGTPAGFLLHGGAYDDHRGARLIIAKMPSLCADRIWQKIDWVLYCSSQPGSAFDEGSKWALTRRLTVYKSWWLLPGHYTLRYHVTFYQDGQMKTSDFLSWHWQITSDMEIIWF